MIMKDLTPFSGAKVFAIMKTPVRGAAAALGLLTLAWPLAWAPGWTYATAAPGAAAVLAGAFARWPARTGARRGGRGRGVRVLRAGTAVLAAEGLFILGYLLAADAPRA